jgi:hypothetical protein
VGSRQQPQCVVSCHTFLLVQLLSDSMNSCVSRNDESCGHGMTGTTEEGTAHRQRGNEQRACLLSDVCSRLNSHARGHGASRLSAALRLPQCLLGALDSRRAGRESRGGSADKGNTHTHTRRCGRYLKRGNAWQLLLLLPSLHACHCHCASGAVVVRGFSLFAGAGRSSVGWH